MAETPPRLPPRANQVLLIDADDTLWETNLRYERVVADFARLLAPLGYAADFVRETVDAAERANIQRRGYGARNFLLTLEEIYAQLAGEPTEGALGRAFVGSPRSAAAGSGQVGEARRAVGERFQAFEEQLLAMPPIVFDGVGDTLAYLSARHRLLLFSKGQTDEQTKKISSSGLGRYFESWEIVSEKDEAAYLLLTERHRFSAGSVWMVGNSPRSDINPALAAGLNAVYIPSRVSWEYENEELRPAGPGELLILEHFRSLQDHF
jgi:putative hydrolase of the HAD superfamily